MDCLAFGPAPKDVGTDIHALSVASVVYGRLTEIRNDQQPSFTVSGFLPPSALLFAANKYLESSQGLGDPTERKTLLASYSEFPDNSTGKIVNIKPEMFHNYIQRVMELQTQESVLVVAAPHKIASEDDFPALMTPDLNRELPVLETCRSWPACIGWTPVALVVAALDKNGQLLEPERYKLGASVIGIAAPGENIPVAISARSGQPGLASCTGSSLAVGAVGALSLLLQSEMYGVHCPMEVIGRIASTADVYTALDKEPDGRDSMNLIRYGRLNANRALTGASERSAVLWKLGERVSSDTQPKAQRIEVEAPRRLNDSAYSCGKEPQGSRGYVRLFEDGENYFRGSHKKQVECREVNTILRLFKSGATSEGIPTFTIVYYDNFRHSKARKRPAVRRDVMLKSSEPNTPTICTWNGEEQGGVPSCLYYRSESRGPFLPLNLLDNDIVFSAKNMGITRSNDQEPWTRYETVVWGKK